VIDAAVDLSVLLGECRNLRLLVTSRELLRLQGEVEYQVPPLEQDEAEDLFCARSRLPRDDEIADLCRHLDDLPLAVELAAARTAVMSPAEIRDRLTQRLDLFKGGRDADPRQQTLRATIEWSYELLDEPERQLFARLAVFAGGCTVDAAEEIADADVDTLQSLVDKSLVRRSGGRFWMLETIAELARERFQTSVDADEIGRRHAEWFLALAEACRAVPERAEAARLAPSAGGRSRQPPKSLTGSSITTSELALRARRCVVAVLVHARPRLRGAPLAPASARRGRRRTYGARAKVLDGAGYLAAEQEGLDEAIPCSRRAFPARRRFEATSAAAIAATPGRGRARSQPSGQESRRAIAEGEEAVALARQAGDDYVLGIALNNLGGTTLMLLQDRERAATYWAESLEIRRRIGDMSRIALSLSNLGWMALLEGQVDRASSLFAEGAEIAGGIGDKRQISHALAGLAWVASLEQRREEADSLARESLAIMRELGMKGGYVDAMFCLAGTAAARGDLARGARLAAAAELCYSLFGSIDIADEARYGAVVESAKAACDRSLGGESGVGRAMNLDEAVGTRSPRLTGLLRPQDCPPRPGEEPGLDKAGATRPSESGSPSKRSTASRLREKRRAWVDQCSEGDLTHSGSGSRTIDLPPRSTNSAGRPPSRTTYAPATRAARAPHVSARAAPPRTAAQGRRRRGRAARPPRPRADGARAAARPRRRARTERRRALRRNTRAGRGRASPAPSARRTRRRTLRRSPRRGRRRG
jgi:tetratricopeptide (TPR) repeat protein